MSSQSVVDELARRTPIVANAVLAMWIVLFTETMFFCALSSSYIVLRGQVAVWPPLDQPRLSVWVTALISCFLIGSGVAIERSLECLRDGQKGKFNSLLWKTFALGSAFVVFQGVEWVGLINFGLTSSSSLYGSLFYTLIGCHALHVVVGLVALGLMIRGWRLGYWGVDSHDGFLAMRMYWLFVVAVWPPLYGVVYLW